MKTKTGKKIGKTTCSRNGEHGINWMATELTRCILVVNALEERVGYLEGICGPRGCLLAWTRTTGDGVPYYVHQPHAVSAKRVGEVFS